MGTRTLCLSLVAMLSTALGTRAATITLQDSVNGYQGTRDTFLTESQGGRAFGNEPLLFAGGNQRMRETQTLLFFDLLDVPDNQRIESAVLTLATRGHGKPDRLQLYPMNIAWNESSTWDSLGGGLDRGSLGAGVNATASTGKRKRHSIQFDVTALVSAWYDGAKENMGWALLDSQSEGKGKGKHHNTSMGFFSSEGPLRWRPALEVSFSPIVPEPLSVVLMGLGALGPLLMRGRFGKARN